MPLINCKVTLKVTWNKNCVISSLDAAGANVVEFMITKTELYVPIVTLSTKDNAKLSKLLNDRFKRSIYCNRCNTVHQTKDADPTYRYQLESAWQGVNRLFCISF